MKSSSAASYNASSSVTSLVATISVMWSPRPWLTPYDWVSDLIGVGGREKPTVGKNDDPTNRDGLEELAVAG
jgi:hypothetical protein